MYESEFYRSRRLFRSRRDKVFSGLCGGMAEHYGVSPGLLRFMMIFGSLLTFPVIPIIYMIMVILIPLEGSEAWHRRESKSKRAYKRDPVPKFRNQEEALSFLNHQFDSIERKVQNMEDLVTSKEYVLKRKFEQL